MAKRLVSQWYGNGFQIKTYRDSDGYYNSVIMSHDFSTREQADSFVERIRHILMRYPNG